MTLCGLMRSSSGLAMIGTLLAAPATAQVLASDPKTDSGPTASQGGLDDIVVTARRRAESVQDVPVSVVAISEERIERYDLTSLERVAASLPQLTVARAPTGSGAQITIRGIGSSPTSIGLEQSVATVIDGVYYGQGRVINEGFFDAARIEVLKGPQALFFGKNATAGVISITLAEPDGSSEGYVRAGYEALSEQVVGEAVLSMPLSETLGVRLSARTSRMFGSYFKNRASTVNYLSRDTATGVTSSFRAPPGDFEGPQERQTLGRLTVKWEPTEQLTLVAKLFGNDDYSNNPGWNRAVYRCPTGISAINPAVPCKRRFDIYQNDLPPEIAASFFRAGGGDLVNRYRSWGATTTVNYEAENVSLTSVTNYQWNRNRFISDVDFQSSNTTQTFASEDTNYRAFSQEIRASSDFDGPVDFMIGGLYQYARRNYHQYVASGGVANSGVTDPLLRFVSFEKLSFTSGDTFAAFGQVRWQATPTVELAAGGRYTRETKRSSFVQPYVNPSLTGIYPAGSPVAARQEFSNLSPEATVSWKPQQALHFYAAYKTAYKSGGFSNSGILSRLGSVEDFTFDPEKARGFEAGVKSELFDRTVRLNLTGYSYKFTNLQVDFFNSAVFAFITTNAGSARSEGVEVEVEWAPRAVPQFRANSSVNFNRARYLEYVAPCYAGQTPALGCTIGAPTGPFMQVLDGRPTAISPKWTASLGGIYDIEIGSAKLQFSVDARYSDSYVASSFGTPLSRQPSYVNLDAALRLFGKSERFELALIGRNLTNRFIVLGSLDGPSTGSGTGTAAGRFADQTGLVGVPRTVQLQATIRY